LYVSEADNEGGEFIGNRIYKYEWDGNILKNGKLIHDLPVNVFGLPQHIGGQMVTGLDGSVYAVTGDSNYEGVTQNFETGDINDSSVILVVNLDESVLKPSKSKNPQDHYVAMGIRNSFGLAIDPITGNLWDTENGREIFDEINLVKPKFNSGWKKIMGPATLEQKESLPTFHNFQYSDPEFTWETPVVPTNLVFVNSEFYDDYQNNLFVGGFNTGTIYKFKVNSERTGFVFNDPALQDLVLNSDESPDEIIFATGIRGPTDLDFGPDGLLYVTSWFENKIYRIKPSPTPLASYEGIPLSIKDIAAGWGAGEKNDEEFVHAIEFLILERIMMISGTESPISSDEPIPNWIKKISGWWNDGSISNFEFVKAIEFLVQNGVIEVNIDKIKCNIKPGPEINLSGCNLSGKDFSGINLSRAKLKNAILTGSNFTGTNLFDSDLSGSNLSNAIFKDASLHSANLQNVNLQGANLEFSDLIGSNLKNSDLSNAVLWQAKVFDAELQNSNLRDSNLQGADFKSANLTGANLSGSNLQNSIFYLSIARDADFSETYALDAIFLQAKLQNALFLNANLTRSDFSLTDLMNANFTGSDLSDAVFEKAKIKDCIGCPLK